MNDLIGRLRHADAHSQQRVLGSRIFAEAADEIERLRKAMGAEGQQFMQALVDEASAEKQKRKAAEAEHQRLRNGITELSLTLPVVGTLFVARGAATARAVHGVEIGPDEHSDLVRATDVTNAFVQAVASLIGATPTTISATGASDDG